MTFERPATLRIVVKGDPRYELCFGQFTPQALQDWQAAKLLKPSAIKPGLATLEQALVIKTLGKLSQRDQQSLKEAIGKIIG